jgi:hypothetical protein
VAPSPEQSNPSCAILVTLTLHILMRFFSAFITKPLSHLNLFARFSLQEKPFRRREHDDTWDAEQK